MIAYHFMQHIADIGVTDAENVFYDNVPLDPGEGVMVSERGGTETGCLLKKTTIYVTVKNCKASEAHRILFNLRDNIDDCVVDLPPVTSKCLLSSEHINEKRYSARIQTISSYESLGQDSNEKWVAQWVYELTYYERNDDE